TTGHTLEVGAHIPFGLAALGIRRATLDTSRGGAVFVEMGTGGAGAERVRRAAGLLTVERRAVPPGESVGQTGEPEAAVGVARAPGACVAFGWSALGDASGDERDTQHHVAQPVLQPGPSGVWSAHHRAILLDEWVPLKDEALIGGHVALIDVDTEREHQVVEVWAVVGILRAVAGGGVTEWVEVGATSLAGVSQTQEVSHLVGHGLSE